MVTLKFVKLSNRWFVDIPYIGSIEDLEMVEGSDKFLNSLCLRVKSNVTALELDISITENTRYYFKFVINDIDSNGATYKCNFPKNIDSIRLCNVTKLIFSDFPRTIYITSIKII
jgi:hypothetical protein